MKTWVKIVIVTFDVTTQACHFDRREKFLYPWFADNGLKDFSAFSLEMT
ncbi:MAG: hypothetical protein Fur0044_23110 [Anaerolineae bacterium]